jgi:hypothetical protein
MFRGVLACVMLMGLFTGPAVAVSIDPRPDDFAVFEDYPRRDAGTVTITLAEDSYSVQCLRASTEPWIDARAENRSCLGEIVMETGVTPVPEPGALVLLALGAATLLVRFWRNVVE